MKCEYMKYICPFCGATESQIELTGGKGRSLIKMIKAGLPVPNGYVILSSAFKEGKITNDAMTETGRLISTLDSRHTYAVRSSALNEDGNKASFAGAYETVLNVEKSNILNAINTVVSSADSARVEQYSQTRCIEKSGIAVVVQQFISPDYAGVLFTANPITRSSAEMTGNFVSGVGESLVSGQNNAGEFTLNALKYSFTGDPKIKPYAKRLFTLAKRIKRLYGCEQDIEWAVCKGRVYILQARPITTLNRIDYERYDINASRSGYYLLNNTNVGEALPRVLTPMMWSILESATKALGMPHFIDNVCGHPYANMSVVISTLHAIRLPKNAIKRFIQLTGDLAGKTPANIEIPVFPAGIKPVTDVLKGIFRFRPRNKYSKLPAGYFFNNCERIMFKAFEAIGHLNTNEELLQSYRDEVIPFIMKLSFCMLKRGNIKGIFGFREMLMELAGEECANTLCSNCSGKDILESMKPVLYIEKVINGSMSKEEYKMFCGHRCPEELEVSTPYPYENDIYIQRLIEDYKQSGISAEKMKAAQSERFNKAKAEFLQRYPKKKNWFDRKIRCYQKSEAARELVRSKGILMVCILRSFLLQCAKVNKTGDDIFFLYFDEVMAMLKGNRAALKHVEKRRENYDRYKTLPTLPAVILGHIDPFEWAKASSGNTDFYNEYESEAKTANNVNKLLKGYAGASGIIEGTVRILNDYSESGSFVKGEILVTAMTNIGWTPIFPKAAAIITDIGAPLSHAAIVAREFGIPAVVGCKTATSLLKTGDRVLVDGGKGTVKIL